ncbi:MAG TPA: ABC transporter ATP-binding protein [Planctomycetota bacterium]|nr:ABC transporter ATP-binding protein [Planctomycetota bacterium]
MNSELAVRAEALVKHYDGGLVEALKGLSFEVKTGEVLAIMGPSGSGKSTLLHLLGALDRPTGGRIEILGQDLARIADLAKLRAETLGFVFQLHHLIPNLSLRDNVSLPMYARGASRRERRARAASLLERVGLGHRVDFLPVKVSGGERQRAAIARALVNDPKILLADEPTGSVDTVTGDSIFALFRELHAERNMTLIVITHNDKLGSEVDRVLRIVDGRLASDTRK